MNKSQAAVCMPAQTAHFSINLTSGIQKLLEEETISHRDKTPENYVLSSTCIRKNNK